MCLVCSILGSLETGLLALSVFIPIGEQIGYFTIAVTEIFQHSICLLIWEVCIHLNMSSAQLLSRNPSNLIFIGDIPQCSRVITSRKTSLATSVIAFLTSIDATMSCGKQESLSCSLSRYLLAHCRREGLLFH